MKEITKKVLLAVLLWGGIAAVFGVLSIEYINMGYRGPENDFQTRLYTSALVFLVVLLSISKMFVSIYDLANPGKSVNSKSRKISGFTFGITYLTVVVIVNIMMKETSIDRDALIVPYMFIPAILGLIGVSISNASTKAETDSVN